MDSVKHFIRNENYEIENKRNRLLIKVYSNNKWEYIGYLKYSIKKHDNYTKYVYIDLISVDRDWRNYGYATALVDYLYKKYEPNIHIEVSNMTPLGYEFFTTISPYYPNMVIYK